MEIDRREFLRIAGLATAGLLVPSWLYATVGCKDKNEVDTSVRKEIDWSFLQDITAKTMPPNEVIRKYIPLGPEIGLDPDTAEFNDAITNEKPALEQEIQKYKLFNTKFDISVTNQFYGVPDNPRTTNSLVWYCKQAEEFLYQNLNGLDKHVIDWIGISTGDNHTKEFNQKAFVGNSYHEVRRVKAKYGENNQIIISRAMHQVGSRVQADYDSNQHKFNGYFLFIGMGPTAIVAPFSEIIPLTLTKKQYESGMPLEELSNLQLAEGLSEGIALSLGLKIAKELHIPNGQQRVEEGYKRTIRHPEYVLVSNARRFIEQNGIQNAFDLYMESPKRFLDTIKVLK